MQFPESWLREFCNPPIPTQQLADILTMAGLEVEEIEPVAPPFSGVVVGEIKALEQHPNADRLRVCQVDVGQEQLLNIVCGAPNARAGMRIPCALIGAILPPGNDGKPFLIQTGKLRGIESHGMLCSARELRLSDDHGGLLELPVDAPVGQDIRRFLKLDDNIFTLKLTPNLAHCLSVFGVAREVSALTGAPLIAPAFIPARVSHDQKLPVTISAPDLCGRFTGRIIRNVNPKADTPAWMVERLARCGQRSVGALVDISNYVMFELGRPSHIFDLERLHGGLTVRWGKAGEQLKLLNGNTVTVDGAVGVIADDAQVESLAGIMGGDSTAVSDETRHIYVEAAFWWPQAIAGRSRRFNFSTDAGHRFERGVDPSLTIEHIERITELVLAICGGQPGPMDDQAPNVPRPKPVTLRVARACKVIGMPLSQRQCAAALEGLGLDVAEGDGVVTVVPPSYRFDLQIEEDLIEEVVRMVGYDKLPTTPPTGPITPKLLSESRRGPFAVRRLLAALGYQETINFSFVDERWECELAANATPIRLMNPISSQMSVMRSSLLGSLLQVVKFNIDRRAERVRVFEIGRVFLRDATVENTDSTVEGFRQPIRIAGAAYGPVDRLQWGQRSKSVDFFDVKGDIEALIAPRRALFEPAEHPAMHPGRCARVLIDGEQVGYVGELHPRLRQTWELPSAPLMFEVELDTVLKREVPAFGSVTRHQAVERDLAIVVREKVSYAEMMTAVWATDTAGLLRDAVLFDIYRGKPGEPSGPVPKTGAGVAADEKSLTIRFRFNSDEATLTESQIDNAMKNVMDALASQLGARLRS
jgi:phenylalanyl-tRNA synthetase beta chain